MFAWEFEFEFEFEATSEIAVRAVFFATKYIASEIKRAAESMTIHRPSVMAVPGQAQSEH